MDMIRWRNGVADPFAEFGNLQEEINRLFELSRAPEPRGIFEGACSPAVDVIEEAEKFLVLCDVPGMETGDVEISVAGNVLTLKGERKAMNGTGAHTYREETRAGRFQRTLQLPMAIDPDRVEATLRDGRLRAVLEIKIEINELRVVGRRDGRPEQGRYVLRERPEGDFFQTYTLDETIDPSKVDAVIERGVLTLTLDLKEQVKPRIVKVRGE